MKGYSGSVLSGLLAGWMSSTISYPIDVIKTRAMANVDITRASYLQHLIHGLTWQSLFRGYWVECMDMVPAICASNLLYENFLGVARAQLPNADFLWQCGAAAGASAVVGGTLTYPLLFLRRNMQMEVAFPEQRSLATIVSTTYREFGARGFYRGLAPHLLSLGPQMTLGLVLFEKGRRMLASRAAEIQREWDAEDKKKQQQP